MAVEMQTPFPQVYLKVQARSGRIASVQEIFVGMSSHDESDEEMKAKKLIAGYMNG